MSCETSDDWIRPAKRSLSHTCLRLGSMALFMLLTAAVALSICAEPFSCMDFASPDTTAERGPAPGGPTHASLGAPAANVGYSLDPVPVASDSQWWDGFSRPGVSGIVQAMTLFGDDLAVGGDFGTAGKVRAVGTATWDGAAWAEVGGTLDDVRALAVYDGHLVVGRLGYCGEQLIQIWDGDSWEDIGDGLRAWDDRDHYPPWPPQCWDLPNQVFVLQVYDGKLIAGGNFYNWTAGANPADHLAQWNGTAWSPLGTALSGFPYAMTVYDGKLIVGGYFLDAGGVEANRIAAWDGASWSSLGMGINDDTDTGKSVRALAVCNGKLYAGGEFSKAGSVAVDRLACWDGASWSSIGFVTGGNVGGSAPAVLALAAYDGKLIVGGRFNKAKGALGDYVVAWDGSSWEEMGSGVGGIVNSLMPYGDVLIAGGDFKFAGDEVVYNIAAWDGESWHPMGDGQGLQKDVLTLAVLGDALVAGGEFTIAGDTPANLIAAWDGASWNPMDEGWSHAKSGALVSSEGELFGKHGHVVKRWNGSSWEDYTSDFGEDIRTLSFYDGRFVAAGRWVAQWDGASWTSLGSASNGYVAALLEADGDLIVGGHFTTIGGTAARSVARWDGSAWSAMGDGLRYNLEWEEEVSALGLFAGEIVAGGHFDLTGNRLIKCVARWDGEAWQPLYKGVARDTGTYVYCLGVYNGTLVAAGDFRWAGDLPAWNIARWNGSSWSPMGSGVGVYESIGGSTRDYIVKSLAAYDGCLYAGGDFPRAGGKTSFHIARWKDAFPGMVTYFGTSVSGSDVRLTWTNPATGAFRGTLIRYSIYSYPMGLDEGDPLPNGNQGRFEGAPGSEASFDFAGVEGLRYYFTAFAYDDESNYSTPAFASATAATAPDTLPPDPPLDFAAVADTGGIHLEWTNPGDGDLQGVVIRFARAAYPTQPADGEPVPNGDGGLFRGGPGASGSFVHTGLPLGQVFYYSAWSYDADLNYSDAAHASYISVVDTVETFIAIPGDSSVDLFWAAPPCDSCEHYDAVVIRYSPGEFPASVEDGEPVPNGEGGRFVIARKYDTYGFHHTGLEPGTTYKYSAFVVSDDPARTSLPIQREATLTSVVPGTTQFEAIGEDRSVRLTWTAPDDPDIAGVRIRYSTTAPPEDFEDGVAVENGNDGVFATEPGASGDFTHAGLLNGDLYYYTIWTLDAAGHHSAPAHAQATPVDDQPPELWISVLQNPYLSEYLDIYVLASEEVIPDSMCVRVAADTVAMDLLNAAYNLWRGDYTLSASAASVTITARAYDLAGNGTSVTLDFAAGYIGAELGGRVVSPDGKLRLRIYPNTIKHDAFIVVTPCSGESGIHVRGVDLAVQSGRGAPGAYAIGPVGLLGECSATLEVSYADGDVGGEISPDRLYIEQDGVGPLACYVDPEGRVVFAEIHDLGVFRLAIGEPGVSRIMDPAYLAVESARPNPFSRETSVRFEIRATQHVRAVVYDITGREMSRLLEDTIGPGTKTITWTGEGRSGKVPSGVYFLKISTDRQTATRKILLLR
jgi:hypothetical protein